MVKGKQAWVTAQSAGAKLASADYHGAKLMVVRSKCVSTVSLKGIVVRDTKFTFRIITEKNEKKSTSKSIGSSTQAAYQRLAIPKNHTMFRFSIPQPDAVVTSEEPALAKDISDVDMGSDSLVFEIHGSSFEYRAIDRAIKKFKLRHMTEI